MGLQLREQLRILTGFPFHFLLPEQESKNQNSRQRYTTISKWDHFLTEYFAYLPTTIAFDFLHKTTTFYCMIKQHKMMNLIRLIVLAGIVIIYLILISQFH